MMCKFEENQMKFSVSLLALGLGKPVDLGKVSPKKMRKSLVICQTSLEPPSLSLVSQNTIYKFYVFFLAPA